MDRARARRTQAKDGDGMSYFSEMFDRWTATQDRERAKEAEEAAVRARIARINEEYMRKLAGLLDGQ